MLSLTRCRNALALSIAFIIAIWAGPVAAQTAPEAPLPSSTPAATSSPAPEESPAQAPLSLSQLLQLGRSRNPEWAAALAGPRAAEGELLQAGMTPNPEVSVSTDYELPFDGDPLHLENVGLAVSQEFELGGKRQARIAAATARLEAARQRAREVERQLRLDLHNAYAELLYAQLLLELRADILRTAEANLKLTEGRLKAGDVAGVDVMQLRSDVALRRSELEAAAGQVRSSATGLTRLFGESLGASVSVAGQLGGPRTIPPLAELHQLASTRPDILQANAESEAAEKEIAVQETSGVSNLTASLGLSREHLLIDEDAITPHGIIHGIDDRAWVASIQLSIPIPINNTNEGNIIRARAEADGARLQKDVAAQKVHTEVSQAYAEWEAALRTLEPLEEAALDNARQAYEIVDQAYRLGHRSILDVLQARQEYLQVRLARLEALRTVELSIARLEAVTGSPLGEDPQP
jgi:cobalt-zinc-cadmium efflux system outer membrane protein